MKSTTSRILEELICTGPQFLLDLHKASAAWLVEQGYASRTLKDDGMGAMRAYLTVTPAGRNYAVFKGNRTPRLLAHHLGVAVTPLSGTAVAVNGVTYNHIDDVPVQPTVTPEVVQQLAKQIDTMIREYVRSAVTPLLEPYGISPEDLDLP